MSIIFHHDTQKPKHGLSLYNQTLSSCCSFRHIPYSDINHLKWTAIVRQWAWNITLENWEDGCAIWDVDFWVWLDLSKSIMLSGSSTDIEWNESRAVDYNEIELIEILSVKRNEIEAIGSITLLRSGAISKTEKGTRTLCYMYRYMLAPQSSRTSFM